MNWGKVTVLGLVGLFLGLASRDASAIPTREELYRSDKLGTVIYKDGTDPNVFWYLPPVRLYENEGKIVYYKRPAGDKVTYYFYILPFMNDDLIELLAGEVPGLQNKTQFKPVIAKQFGIKVRQFEVVSMGEVITDYHYINKPQLVKLSLSAANADEFEFFINNKPGVMADVLFSYESERMDKYLTIELSFKEVYNALNIGATGKYQFTRAEIETGLSNYLGQKYYNIRSKGDIPVPEIINKAIEECFTPYKKPENEKKKKGYKDWSDDWLLSPVSSSAKDAALDEQKSLLDSLAFASGWDIGDGKGTGTSSEDDKSSSKGDGPSGGKGSGLENISLEFTFKKELANSEKTFFYKQEHFVDSSETASVPVYLSLLPSEVKAKVVVAPTVKKNLIVEAANEAVSPLRTGIMVRGGEQYIITAAFAMSARSAYQPELRWYRWDSKWPNVDEELYFRVGNSPWNKVNGRAVIKTEGIYRGELQFMLDRKKIWDKIPKDFKDSKMLGLVPAIFTYKLTYPQFNVVVNGRKIEITN